MFFNCFVIQSITLNIKLLFLKTLKHKNKNLPAIIPTL